MKSKNRSSSDRLPSAPETSLSMLSKSAAPNFARAAVSALAFTICADGGSVSSGRSGKLNEASVAFEVELAATVSPNHVFFGEMAMGEAQPDRGNG
jgi:hypothetical protein